jgi:hypothetical protein
MRPVSLAHCLVLLEQPDVRRFIGDQAGDPYAQAFQLERLLRSALNALDDGPSGHAARLLLGAAPESRGRLLKVRRRLAADELDVLPSTFRKNYESGVLDDIAVEIWRILTQS